MMNGLILFYCIKCYFLFEKENKKIYFLEKGCFIFFFIILNKLNRRERVKNVCKKKSTEGSVKETKRWRDKNTEGSYSKNQILRMILFFSAHFLTH